MGRFGNIRGADRFGHQPGRIEQVSGLVTARSVDKTRGVLQSESDVIISTSLKNCLAGIRKPAAFGCPPPP